MEVAAGAISTRHDQNVERGMIVEGVLWLHQEVAATAYGSLLLGDRDDVEQPGVVVGLPIQSRREEDLEGATKVQHLDVVEDEDPDGAPATRSSLLTRWHGALYPTAAAGWSCGSGFPWRLYPAAAARTGAGPGGGGARYGALGQLLRADRKRNISRLSAVQLIALAERLRLDVGEVVQRAASAGAD